MSYYQEGDQCRRRPRADRAKVTTSDYEAAVGRFGVCLAESGIKLINDGWDPIDNERMMLRYDAPGMGYDEVSQITGRCGDLLDAAPENRHQVHSFADLGL